MSNTGYCKSLSRWGLYIGFLIAAFGGAGCSYLSSDAKFEDDFPAKTGAAGGTAPAPVNDTTPVPPAAATVPAPSGSAPASSGTATDNTIAVGDSLTITFSDIPNPPPPITQQVKNDGTILLIENQTFTAAGKTRAQLEKEIREKYVPIYFQKMTVNITPLDRVFYIYGEVKVPGRQLYGGPITVLRAIASAGGFTDFAKRKSVIVTRSSGKKERENCLDAQKDASKDLWIYPNDTVHVPRRIL